MSKELEVVKLVESLDQLVPRGGAMMRLDLDGEGGAIYANRDGYAGWELNFSKHPCVLPLPKDLPKGSGGLRLSPHSRFGFHRLHVLSCPFFSSESSTASQRIFYRMDRTHRRCLVAKTALK